MRAFPLVAALGLAAGGVGATPLHAGSEAGHTAVLDTLLTAAPTVLDAPNYWGGTPLHLAAREGHLEAEPVSVLANVEDVAGVGGAS